MAAKRRMDKKCDGRIRAWPGAEGATAPVNSQAKGPSHEETLESVRDRAAEGIAISGKRTEGAPSGMAFARLEPGATALAKGDGRGR